MPRPQYTREQCQATSGHYVVGVAPSGSCWRCGAGIHGYSALPDPDRASVVATPVDVPDELRLGVPREWTIVAIPD
jgi:hypothetical protein